MSLEDGLDNPGTIYLIYYIHEVLSNLICSKNASNCYLKKIESLVETTRVSFVTMKLR